MAKPVLPEWRVQRDLASAASFEDTLRPLSLHLTPRERREALDKACAAARSIGDNATRANALVRLVGLFPSTDRRGIVQEAFSAALELHEPIARANALLLVAAYLSGEKRTRAFGEAGVAARAVSDEKVRSEILSRLPRGFYTPLRPSPPRPFEAELAAAKAIKDVYQRVTELTSLSQRLPPRERLDFLFDSIESLARSGPSKDRNANWHFALVYEREAKRALNQLFLIERHALFGLAPLLSKYLDSVEHNRHITKYREEFFRNLSGYLTKELDDLPVKPKKLWPGRPRGRPQPGSEVLLFDFIREVYGPYLDSHREKLRGYIHRNDLSLYEAIRAYERSGRELPPELALPTRPEVVDERVRKAAIEGLKKLSKPERRSVLGKVRRLQNQRPKP